MINTKAVQQFLAHYQNFKQAANLHDTAFSNNVQRYLELKNLFLNVDVSQDTTFQQRYSFFYGLNRWLSRQQKAAYFLEFEALKKNNLIDVSALTAQMEPSLGKYHFSFCSKMANMINDKQYPIYDSHIRQVFHRPNLGHGHNYYNAMYADIMDTYASLAQSSVITEFQVRYSAQNMGYMKVLDALFWVL